MAHSPPGTSGSCNLSSWRCRAPCVYYHSTVPVAVPYSKYGTRYMYCTSPGDSAADCTFQVLQGLRLDETGPATSVWVNGCHTSQCIEGGVPGPLGSVARRCTCSKCVTRSHGRAISSGRGPSKRRRHLTALARGVEQGTLLAASVRS